MVILLFSQFFLLCFLFAHDFQSFFERHLKGTQTCNWICMKFMGAALVWAYLHVYMFEFRIVFFLTSKNQGRFSPPWWFWFQVRNPGDFHDSMYSLVISRPGDLLAWSSASGQTVFFAKERNKHHSKSLNMLHSHKTYLNVA